jgi:hypothetical protein
MAGRYLQKERQRPRNDAPVSLSKEAPEKLYLRQMPAIMCGSSSVQVLRAQIICLDRAENSGNPSPSQLRIDVSQAQERVGGYAYETLSSTGDVDPFGVLGSLGPAAPGKSVAGILRPDVRTKSCERDVLRGLNGKLIHSYIHQ